MSIQKPMSIQDPMSILDPISIQNPIVIQDTITFQDPMSIQDQIIYNISVLQVRDIQSFPILRDAIASKNKSDHIQAIVKEFCHIF